MTAHLSRFFILPSHGMLHLGKCHGHQLPVQRHHADDVNFGWTCHSSVPYHLSGPGEAKLKWNYCMFKLLISQYSNWIGATISFLTAAFEFVAFKNLTQCNALFGFEIYSTYFVSAYFLLILAYLLLTSSLSYMPIDFLNYLYTWLLTSLPNLPAAIHLLLFYCWHHDLLPPHHHQWITKAYYLLLIAYWGILYDIYLESFEPASNALQSLKTSLPRAL